MNDQYMRQLGAEIDTMKFRQELESANRNNNVNPMSPGQIDYFVAERLNDMYHMHGCDPASPRYFDHG